MIGVILNVFGGMFNLWCYKKYSSEGNLLCAKINFSFAFFFLLLYLFSIPFLRA